MSRSLTHILGALCLALCGTAGAEPPVDNPDNETALPVSGYPEAWCIKSYVAAVRRFPGVATTRRAPAPPTSSLSLRSVPAPVQRDMPDEFADRTSLIEQIKALKNLKFATLWQGRDQDLVLGLQDGGYVGLSLRNDDAGK